MSRIVSVFLMPFRVKMRRKQRARLLRPKKTIETIAPIVTRINKANSTVIGGAKTPPRNQNFSEPNK